jgi:hypothetical protein
MTNGFEDWKKENASYMEMYLLEKRQVELERSRKEKEEREKNEEEWWKRRNEELDVFYRKRNEEWAKNGELEVQKLELVRKRKLILNETLKLLLEKTRKEGSDFYLFEPEEGENYGNLTEGGIRKISEVLIYVCDKNLIGVNNLQTLFDSVFASVDMLKIHGFKGKGQASKLEEIFYWAKVGS